MRNSIGIAMAVLCVSCSRHSSRETPPAAYQRWQDRIVASTYIPFFGNKPLCATRYIRTETVSAWEELPDDQCFKFDPPRRWKGLWRNDFEGSQFCPEPAATCQYVRAADRVGPAYWLKFAGQRPASLQSLRGGFYAVHFVGRGTSFRGAYGHLGMSDHEVLVDRLISIKEVELPPAAPDERTLK